MNGSLLVAGMIGLMGIAVVIAQVLGDDGDAEVDTDVSDAVTMTNDHDSGDIDIDDP